MDLRFAGGAALQGSKLDERALASLFTDVKSRGNRLVSDWVFEARGVQSQSGSAGDHLRRCRREFRRLDHRRLRPGYRAMAGLGDHAQKWESDVRFSAARISVAAKALCVLLSRSFHHRGVCAFVHIVLRGRFWHKRRVNPRDGSVRSGSAAGRAWSATAGRLGAIYLTSKVEESCTMMSDVDDPAVTAARRERR
jgi:hypothetical protein